MPSLNIRRNDTVKVLTGSDRGKTGRVLRVFPDKGTVLVEHVRVVKKTVSSKRGTADQGRHRRAGVADQRVERGAGLPQLRRRSAWATREGDTKVAVCKKCGQTLPTKK
jgi:large subunit ribosomal protein L24